MKRGVVHYMFVLFPSIGVGILRYLSDQRILVPGDDHNVSILGSGHLSLSA